MSLKLILILISIALEIKNEFNYQYNLSTNVLGIDNLDASVGRQLIYTPRNKRNLNSSFSFNDYNLVFNQSFVGKVIHHLII